jgi:hypothetical protein
MSKYLLALLAVTLCACASSEPRCRGPLQPINPTPLHAAADARDAS